MHKTLQLCRHIHAEPDCTFWSLGLAVRGRTPVQGTREHLVLRCTNVKLRSYLTYSYGRLASSGAGLDRVGYLSPAILICADQMPCIRK